MQSMDYEENKANENVYIALLALEYALKERSGIIRCNVAKKMLLKNMDTELIFRIVKIDAEKIEKLKSDTDSIKKKAAVRIARRILQQGNSDINYISKITALSINEMHELQKEILSDENSENV